MSVFGILLTPGHLILMGVGIVVYDAIWSWAFSDKQSAWWFERLQGLLKVGIYAGFVGLVTLVAFTPWPWNLVLVVATAASVASFVGWLRARKNSKSPKKEEK